MTIIFRLPWELARATVRASTLRQWPALTCGYSVSSGSREIARSRNAIRCTMRVSFHAPPPSRTIPAALFMTHVSCCRRARQPPLPGPPSATRTPILPESKTLLRSRHVSARRQGGYLGRVGSNTNLGQIALEDGLEEGHHLHSTPTELGVISVIKTPMVCMILLIY